MSLTVTYMFAVSRKKKSYSTFSGTMAIDKMGLCYFDAVLQDVPDSLIM
jgi:hypothetical protein